MTNKFIALLKKDLRLNFYSWLLVVAGFAMIFAAKYGEITDVDIEMLERRSMAIAGAIIMMVALLSRHASAINRLNKRIEKLEQESEE